MFDVFRNPPTFLDFGPDGTFALFYFFVANIFSIVTENIVQ